MAGKKTGNMYKKGKKVGILPVGETTKSTNKMGKKSKK